MKNFFGLIYVCIILSALTFSDENISNARLITLRDFLSFPSILPHITDCIVAREFYETTHEHWKYTADMGAFQSKHTDYMLQRFIHRLYGEFTFNQLKPKEQYLLAIANFFQFHILMSEFQKSLLKFQNWFRVEYRRNQFLHQTKFTRGDENFQTFLRNFDFEESVNNVQNELDKFIYTIQVDVYNRKRSIDFLHKLAMCEIPMTVVRSSGLLI